MNKSTGNILNPSNKPSVSSDDLLLQNKCHIFIFLRKEARKSVFQDEAAHFRAALYLEMSNHRCQVD